MKDCSQMCGFKNNNYIILIITFFYISFLLKIKITKFWWIGFTDLRVDSFVDIWDPREEYYTNRGCPLGSSQSNYLSASLTKTWIRLGCHCLTASLPTPPLIIFLLIIVITHHLNLAFTFKCRLEPQLQQISSLTLIGFSCNVNFRLIGMSL